ncbi:ArsC/Spx/MgsR family protein [Hyphomonas sp.]|jgi:arsenate reductase|uniref:ArsC/Spx/MgsR family protein n=1 Tax=Hyphomonas sp. TaxID=87 RepID=UPI0025BC20C7|nr:ArsC/Spx/MgsR family protein [Hyphomonas sp.]
MTYVLIHNPGCGSSKKGLELLEARGVKVEVRKYMSLAERLSIEELKDIAKKMGAKSPREFLRAKDAEAAGLSEGASDQEVYSAMAENPKLIQRPIGINGEKSVLGRPNEKLLEIV